MEIQWIEKSHRLKLQIRNNLAAQFKLDWLIKNSTKKKVDSLLASI